MTRYWPLVFLLLPAAQCARWRTDAERYGHSEKDLNAPPSADRMKAAVINDVRNWRRLDQRPAEGRPTCEFIRFRDGAPICSVDQDALEEYVFPNKKPFEPHPVEEKAYYCRRENVYYYNFKGGPHHRNLWFGPYPLKRTRPDLEEK